MLNVRPILAAPGLWALAVLSVGAAACAPPAAPTYTFRCVDGYTVRATFIHDSVRLQLPDTTLRMSHLVSADGGRYGADSLIFWERGNSAFIQHGDSVIHRDCVRTNNE